MIVIIVALLALQSIHLLMDIPFVNPTVALPIAMAILIGIHKRSLPDGIACAIVLVILHLALFQFFSDTLFFYFDSRGPHAHTLAYLPMQSHGATHQGAYIMSGADRVPTCINFIWALIMGNLIRLFLTGIRCIRDFMIAFMSALFFAAAIYFHIVLTLHLGPWSHNPIRSDLDDKIRMVISIYALIAVYPVYFFTIFAGFRKGIFIPTTAARKAMTVHSLN